VIVLFLATLTFKVFAILLESIPAIPKISMAFVHLIQDPRKVEDQGKRNGSRGPLNLQLRRRRRKRGRYQLNLMIRLSYRATNRKKMMEEGAKKKQQRTIRGESDNDDNMIITELAKSKSKSGKELSVCNVAKGEKTKATKATLTKKGGKKKTGFDSPKKRSASSPKKMSASSPKTKTSRKAGRKQRILKDLVLCCQLMARFSIQCCLGILLTQKVLFLMLNILY
jgi:hypothetical protein